ncbi:MAG TPA: DUF433 domain-containing protein [archaeon]|nr:DUF433 domain-containing protein [archaeon]
MQLSKESRIVKDGLMSGSPRIAGTRIRVRDIVEKYVVSKDPPALIAKEFRVSISDVHAALSYYYDNIEEIREEVRKDKLFVEKFRKEMIRHEIPS